MAAERAPFPGLRSFGPDESDIFFGRDDCIDAMLGRLAATRFLAVLGSSGIGKSSLVKTGLLSALQMGLLRGAGSSWLVAEFRPIQPEGSPLRNLVRGLLEASGEPITPENIARMRAQFMQEGPRALLKWCGEGHLPPATNLLLLVDQFEELFRYQDYSGREEAEAFVALLLESRKPLEADEPQMAELPIYVTLTMRSEFLGACSLIQQLPEAITEGAFLTPRMTRDQYREAIVGPAEVCGIGIEETLVNRMLNDLAAFAPWDEKEQEQPGGAMSSEAGDAQDQVMRLARRADQLPVLQHALNRIWRRAYERAKAARGTSDDAALGPIELTLDDYKAIGGLENALNAHADAILDSVGVTLGGDVERAAERLFRGLVTGSTPSEAVRRPTPLRDLIEIAEGERAVRAIVEAFRADECNFLMPEPAIPLARDTMVDISHESLIRQWKRLSRWVAVEATAAQQWRRLNDHFNVGEPLHGRALYNLVAWRDETMPNAAWAKRYGGGDYASVIAFLNKSERTEKNRRLVRRSLFAGAFLTLAAVTGVMTALYLSVLSERRRALDASIDSIQVATLARQQFSDVVSDYIDSVGDTLSWAPPAWSAYLHRRKAGAFNKAGNFASERTEIDLAQKADPDYLPALISSSDLAVIVGDADRAVRDTTAYLQVIKTDVIAYGNIILAEAMRRNYDEAVGQIDRALQNAHLPIEDIESTVAPDIQKLTHGFQFSVPDSDFLLALRYTKAAIYAMNGDGRFEAALNEADQSDRDKPYSRNAYLAALNWQWLIVRGQAIYDAQSASADDNSSPPDELTDYGAYAVEGALWDRVALTRPEYREHAVRAYEKFQIAYRSRPQERYRSLMAWVESNRPQERYRSLMAWVEEALQEPFRPAEVTTVDVARTMAQRAQELKAMEGTHSLNFEPAFAQLSKAIELLRPQPGTAPGRRQKDLLIDLLLRRADWRLQGSADEQDKGAAADDAREVIELDRNTPEAYRVLANAATDDATRRANDEQALKIDPYNSGALDDLAQLTKDPKEALALLQKRQRVVTYWVEGRLALSKAQAKLGNFPEALRQIDSAIEDAPWRLDLYEERRNIERESNTDPAIVELHYAQGLRRSAGNEASTGNDGLALKRYLLAFITVSNMKTLDSNSKFELDGIVRDLSTFLSKNYGLADTKLFWSSLSQDPLLNSSQHQLAAQEAARLAH